MGLWDNVKKVVSFAMDAADQGAKKVTKRTSDKQLTDSLKKNPNNRYLKDEAKKRGY